MPAGFEMLIHNFSVGILGMLLAMISFLVIGPFMQLILRILSVGVNALMTHGILPLIAVFIEPAKVLFLNNAMNHGIFTPIATAQAAETGRSIMYMLESNPGPGLGVLLAYMFFCEDKKTKQSAPGAVIIHLLGGIHEIYFPYILMNPLVILAPILGNVAAIFWYSLTGSGLVGPASPGSILAYSMMAPKGGIVTVLVGVVLAAAISFGVASVIIRMSRGKSLEEAQEEMARSKAQARGQVQHMAGEGKAINGASGVKKVVFACDAGMGSSAMGATKFRNRIKVKRPDLTVTNTSVDNIPSDCDIAVVQVTLAERARRCAPGAQLVTIGNFLADPALDTLYEQLIFMEEADKETGSGAGRQNDEETGQAPAAVKENQVLVKEGIRLNLAPVPKEAAIQAAGELLTELGYVDASYVDAMQERERIVTTYMGLGVAIPHGTSQAKGTVKKTGIVLLQYPDGVDFGDEKAQLVFGIAGIGDEHLELLSKICTMLEEEEILEQFKTTDDADWMLEQLN